MPPVRVQFRRGGTYLEHVSFCSEGLEARMYILFRAVGTGRALQIGPIPGKSHPIFLQAHHPLNIRVTISNIIRWETVASRHLPPCCRVHFYCFSDRVESSSADGQRWWRFGDS